MNTPKFDWTINVSTMLAIGGVLAVAVTGWFTLREQVNVHTRDIDSLTRAQAELVLKRDTRIVEVDRRLAGFDEVRYRVQAAEEALKSTNARVDASLANISARLAEINQALGGLDTKVAVLTQRLEMQAPGRRASILPPLDDPASIHLSPAWARPISAVQEQRSGSPDSSEQGRNDVANRPG